MSTVEPKTQLWRTAKASEKRRGVRMNSRVPVGIEWEDGQGQKVRNKAFTCVVSSYGCLVVLPEELSLEQSVRVLNLSSEQILSGIVVWKGNLRPEGWEFGIELNQPPMDFWGLEL
jgi:PilZ domain